MSQLLEKSAFMDTRVTGIFSILLKLGLVILLIYVTLFLIKKLQYAQRLPVIHLFRRKPMASPIQSLSFYPLSPTASLHLIQIAQRVFLLSVSSNEIKILREFSDNESSELIQEIQRQE